MKITSESIIGFIFIIIASMFTFKVVEVSNNKNLNNKDFYYYFANLSNVNGIETGTKVKISGIDVGSVVDLELQKEKLTVDIKIKIDKSIKIAQDSVLAVSTDGLFGSKFISIQSGFEDNFLKDGDKIKFTRSALNLEELISKFVAK